MIGRRSFLFGLGAAAVTAPAIIRPGILMPVKKMLVDEGVALIARDHPVLMPTLTTSAIPPFSLVEVPASLLQPAKEGLRIAGVVLDRRGPFFRGDLVAYREPSDRQG